MKKGQAALEFLTTYGWAFLVILVMIGALAYFGVLNPSNLLPDKCLFGNGIGGCVDYGYDSGSTSVEAIVVNNYGAALTATLWNFTVIGCDGASTPSVTIGSATADTTAGLSSNISSSNPWAADQRAVISLSCNFDPDSRPKITVDLVGNKAGSAYPVINTGTIQVKIPS